MHLILYSLILLASLNLYSAEKPKLSDYRMNVYSQFGEDGMVEKIFDLIGTTSKVAVEFGAANGFFCSNTANLWSKDPTWTALLIESDPSLYKQLAENTADRSHCRPVHAKVGISNSDSIETILGQMNVGPEIDICSIDIDGNDYHVFQSFRELRPRLIVCEYNPTIPAHLDLYGEYGNHLGCSVRALERIGKEKGYSLVAITESNCFFIVNEELPHFAGFDLERENLRINRFVRYVMTDYSGKYMMIGEADLDECWGIREPITEKCGGKFTYIPTSILQIDRATKVNQ